MSRHADVDRTTARRVLSTAQAGVLAGFALAVLLGLFIDRYITLLLLIAAAMGFWLIFVGFRAAVWIAASSYRFPPHRVLRVKAKLPSYTIFVPLYREGRMVPRLVESISKLRYPTEKLQVLLLLEKDDDDTWAAVKSMALPPHFVAVEIPPGGPKTKPNALNFGLAIATGKYCVIYDAEDRPEADQLLQAVAGFKDAADNVACLQARLVFWNGTSTWVTRFYWTEYVAHFEWVLAGMAKLGVVPPLGGTSNHFITARLREVAIRNEKLPFAEGYVGAWDPFNVTEDAELAAALAAHGYRIAMLDSVTLEEATAHLSRADKQRRRWLKGYAQTGLVYTQHPIRTARQMGFKNWFFFVLLMLGTPISLLLTPLFWAATIVYFTTKAGAISDLFPAPLYYTGMVLMLVGNLIFFYQMMCACLKRESYGSVKFMLLLPFWWIFTSWSAYAMVFELIVRPHHWHKTEHGHDLEKEDILFAARRA